MRVITDKQYTEYDDLMKQAEEHNKQLHRTKDINAVSYTHLTLPTKA